MNIRLPQITNGTQAQQMQQVKSYLYQLVEQLNISSEQNESQTQQLVQQTIAQAAQKTSPQETFSSIKSLIIKSADIVNAYYDEINRKLEGIYVAEANFPSGSAQFVEETSQSITETSTRIDQMFENMQEIISDLEGVQDYMLEVNAYIRSGLLYEDEAGTPVYGLEIGQKNTVNGEEVFNKFARFTASKLSFYDQNDTEVAYISDYKLYITNAQVTGSLRIGDFTIETATGLTMKYVGE